MKTFLIRVTILLIAVIAISFLLDYTYVKIYENGVYRSKVSWVRQMERTDSLDYVLLGNSRVEFHLNPVQIEKRTGLKGLNLGIAASGPVEVKLMLKQALNKLKFKKLYIEVDTKFNYEKPNDLARVTFMPFIDDPLIYEEFKRFGGDYNFYLDLPFYRFQKFDPKIGLRNVSLIIAGKKADNVGQLGYLDNGMPPFRGPIHNKYKLKDSRNKIYEEIVALCQKENIEVHFYTSPIYNNKIDFNILNKYLPNYHNFSDSVKAQNQYTDLTHLNREGAKVFTDQFINFYLK